MKDANMTETLTFTDPRLAELDGFHVQLNVSNERADIILARPPYNVISISCALSSRLSMPMIACASS